MDIDHGKRYETRSTKRQKRVSKQGKLELKKWYCVEAYRPFPGNGNWDRVLWRRSWWSSRPGHRRRSRGSAAAGRGCAANATASRPGAASCTPAACIWAENDKRPILVAAISFPGPSRPRTTKKRGFPHLPHYPSRCIPLKRLPITRRQLWQPSATVLLLSFRFTSELERKL